MQHTSQPQLTVRAVVVGMFLGGILSLSNLYVVLKTGWSFGVSITAGILAFAIFAIFARVGLTRTPFGMLENNAMQSVASAAGYMTGGGTAAAIPALMMLTGESMDPLQMFLWIAAIAFLGVIVAIPMKQQMINIEQLRFPTGVAAAETLQALHAASHAGTDDVKDGNAATGEKPVNTPVNKARLLSVSGLLGAFVAWFRDAHASWIPFNLPEKLKIPFLTIGGKPADAYTFYFEGSTILVAAGAIMGFRSAWSLLLGAVINYTILAPWIVEQGIITTLNYKSIVGWSVWFGSALVLTSGLLAFAFQWKTVVRALQSVKQSFATPNSNAPQDPNSAIQLDDNREVPMKWFLYGVAIFSPIVVFLEYWIFGIKPWIGVLSVILSFFIAIVACRATGETDTTPTGALGKITQITFGVLDPGNMTTNLMTANVTGGVALHSADLLTDLKSGYLLGADPRQQFWAQFFGVIAGSLCVVPAYHALIPSADQLGTEQWPVPGAVTWKNVAELLAKGFGSLHPTAQYALFIGAALGIVLVLIEKAAEKYAPQAKKYIPSATGFGLAFTMPAYNALSMFAGALIALLIEKNNKKFADDHIVPVSSGLIAGESLMGILVALLMGLGILSK